ncbi:isochorismate synthase [Magnetospirillum fulvum]|uniref:isochorismate synthase n=1 Tax=Magnetospirillum fulvum TaxID=1082 RepID=A0A1H6HSQ1_MAGFU|nr:isochorismate synthase [Magnetospirillum fulvum]SEH37184.1 isochorismate synthase [Magnetospirillum fulvum]
MPVPSQRDDARPVPNRLLAALSRRLERLDVPKSGLFSATLAVPELDGIPTPPPLPDLWSWLRPGDGLALIASGTALELVCSGPETLDEARRGLDWAHLDLDGSGAEPVAFLGHGFGGPDRSGLPPALLRVPRLLLRCVSGRCDLIFSHAGGASPDQIRLMWLDEAARLLDALDRPVPPSPPVDLVRLDEFPSPHAFRDRVSAATDAIAAGRVEKVVLSRRITVAAPRPFRPERLARELASRHPSCAIFTVGFGGRTLVAASPERLVACNGRRVESYALAGTAPSDPADPFLGGRLLSGAKDRHEHRLVVGWISSALNDLCDDLDVPSEPRRMILGQLEHLWTPISGTLKPGTGLLQAALALHPTPAVAGLPLASARILLDELGESRSGWYTGAFGWIDRAGDGEMAVVLRCALLDGNRAEVAAGAGIVAASDPEAEFTETELKLRTMLDALRSA